jgi:hypothetical protein
VLRTWHETGRCRHGSPEVYVRKHWYGGHDFNGTMKLYFDRSPAQDERCPMVVVQHTRRRPLSYGVSASMKNSGFIRQIAALVFLADSLFNIRC